MSEKDTSEYGLTEREQRELAQTAEIRREAFSKLKEIFLRILKLDEFEMSKGYCIDSRESELKEAEPYLRVFFDKKVVDNVLKEDSDIRLDFEPVKDGNLINLSVENSMTGQPEAYVLLEDNNFEYIN